MIVDKNMHIAVLQTAEKIIKNNKKGDLLDAEYVFCIMPISKLGGITHGEWVANELKLGKSVDELKHVFNEQMYFFENLNAELANAGVSLQPSVEKERFIIIDASAHARMLAAMEKSETGSH